MKKLAKENVKIVIDTREQRPYCFDGYATETKGLNVGDYSVEGLENYIVVERKELSDIIGCITSGRARFERELCSMRAYQKRVVVIESTWNAIVSGSYRSKVNPLSASNTIISWMNRYNTPFMFAGSRELSESFTQEFLFSSASNLFKICQSFNFKQ